VRSAQSPQALIIETARLGTHSKGDDTRDDAALEKLWQTRDPVAIPGARLEANARASIDREVEEAVLSAFKAALETEGGEG